MNLIKSEFRKMIYAKSFWLSMLGGVLLTALSSAASPVSIASLKNSLGGVTLTNKGLIDELLSKTMSGYLFAAIFGIILMAGEFKNQTAVRTFLASPKRAEVLYSKILIAISGGILIMLVSAAIGLITFISVLSAYPHVSPDTSSIIFLFVDSIIMGVVMGLLGLAIGTLIRNQNWAVSGTLVFLLVVEPLLILFWSAAAKYTPTGLMTSVMNYHLTLKVKGAGFSFDPSQYLKPAPAVALLLLYALIAGFIAVRVTLKRDID